MCPIEDCKLHAPIDSLIIHAITQGILENKHGMSLDITNLEKKMESF